MSEDEGLNVNQGRAYPVSETAQHVPNVKLSPGGRDQQPASPKAPTFGERQSISACSVPREPARGLEAGAQEQRCHTADSRLH